MPFVRANVQIKMAAVGTGIRAGLRAGKRNAPQVTFFVTSDTATMLGWIEADKIEVLLGDGPEHGLVRLRKDAGGQAVLQKRKAAYGGHFFQIKIGVQPTFVNRTEKAASCKWERLDGEAPGFVEIVLPTWADATRPAPKASVAPPVSAAPLVRRGPGRPPKSVTAGLMGDPPAGRRELLARMGEMKG